jgi:hypothetical protein
VGETHCDGRAGEITSRLASDASSPAVNEPVAIIKFRACAVVIELFVQSKASVIEQVRRLPAERMFVEQQLNVSLVAIEEHREAL